MYPLECGRIKACEDSFTVSHDIGVVLGVHHIVRIDAVALDVA